MGRDESVLEAYTFDGAKTSLSAAYSYKFRFSNFIGGLRFYILCAAHPRRIPASTNAFEDRVLNALTFSEDFEHAKNKLGRSLLRPVGFSPPPQRSSTPVGAKVGSACVLSLTDADNDSYRQR